MYFNLGDFDSNNFEIEINVELQKVSMWLKLNKLSLNLDKTKLMIFHRQQKKVKELNITINDTNIARCNHLIFSELLFRKACLGLIICCLLKRKYLK